MQAQRQTERLEQPAPDSALVRQRTELEAKLLAHRCGWTALDDFQVRKLERALTRVLDRIGAEDRSARALARSSRTRSDAQAVRL